MKAAHREDRTMGVVVLVAAFISLCAVHAPLIAYKTYANVDEAYAMAIAERLLEGHKLYQGAVSQRGPLMYYAFEGLAWLHGWDGIRAFRLWALGFSIAHVGLVYLIAKRTLSERAAAAATALTAYALVFGFPAFDAYALHGETLQLPAMLASACFGALAMREAPETRKRWLYLGGAGLLLGVAASIKQSVVVQTVPIVVWIVIDAHRRRRLRRAPLELGLLLATCIVLPALFIVHSAIAGTLKELVYYTYTYNRDVHMRPTHRLMPVLSIVFFRLSEQTSFFILCAVLSAYALPRLFRRLRAAWVFRSLWSLGRGFGTTSYFGLHFAIAVLGASSMFRFFPHYFLQAWPFGALFAGALYDRAMRARSNAVRSRALLVTATLFVVFCATLGTIFGERVDGRVAHDRTVQDLGKYIEGTTTKDQRIFVWGFSSWLYEYAHRRPAGRYMFETYVTGMVPWFWEKLPLERARVVPGSVEGLLGDLELERPEVVVDAGSIMLARPMRAYAPFAAFLRRDYCFEMRFGAFDVYRRKDPVAPCAAPWLPLPHISVDWSGHPIGVGMPQLVADGLTRRLPRGTYGKPIVFENEPMPGAVDLLLDPRLMREEAEAQREGFSTDD